MKHLNRNSYFEVAEHRLDENLQLGFDYRDKLMERSVSNYFYGDPKREDILKQFNDLYVYLIDSVKNIKKTFMLSVDRNSRNLN